MRKTIEENRIYSDFEGGRLWAVVKKTAKTITVQDVRTNCGANVLGDKKKILKLSEVEGIEVAKQKNITLFADCRNVYGVKIQFEKFEEFEKEIFGGEDTAEEMTTENEKTEADEMKKAENKTNKGDYELICYSSAIYDKEYFDGLKDEKDETETAETETETTTAAEEETATAETTTETATAEPTATAETAETTTENATETTTAETEEPPTIEEIAAEIKATCGDDRLKIWEEVTAWAESGKTNAAKLEIAELLFESLGFLEKGEKLHTFSHWKNSGYSVKKGEKTFLRLNIWKSYEKKTDKNENGEEEKETKFILKNSCFFASHQVEKSGYFVKKDGETETAAAFKATTAAKMETAATATAEAVTAEEKEKAAKITEIKAATETTGKGLDLRGYCRINGHHITFARRNGYTESGNRSKDVKKSTWSITCPTLSNPWAVYVYTPYSVYNANVYSYTLANSKIYNYNYQQRIEPQTAAADDSIYNLIYTMLEYSEKPENNKKKYKFENEKAKGYFLTEYAKHKTAKETAEKAAAEIAEYLNGGSLPEAVKSTLEIQLKAEKETAEKEGKQFAALCEVFENCGEKPQK
jgi:hypothetical protein